MNPLPTEWNELCAILCPGDPTLLDEIDLAFRTPARYLQEFSDTLLARGIEEENEVSPWLALVDGLISRQCCNEMDWKIEPGELAWQLNKIESLRDKDQILSPLANSPAVNDDALALASNCLRQHDLALLVMDIDSDSYPLVVAPQNRSSDIQRLSSSLGKRAIVVQA